MPGAGHPFGYFSQEQIEELGDEDTGCLETEWPHRRHAER